MPIPTKNTTPTTVEEFIAGAEEWGDIEIFSERLLKDFAQRMLNASDEYDCTFGASLSKNKKINITVYHPNFDKADLMSDIMGGSFKALNGLLNEIFRLRSELRKVQEEK